MDKEEFHKMARDNLKRLIEYLQKQYEDGFGNTSVFLHLGLSHPEYHGSFDLHTAGLQWSDFGFLMQRILKEMNEYNEYNTTVNAKKMDGTLERIKTPGKESLN